MITLAVSDIDFYKRSVDVRKTLALDTSRDLRSACGVLAALLDDEADQDCTLLAIGRLVMLAEVLVNAVPCFGRERIVVTSWFCAVCEAASTDTSWPAAEVWHVKRSIYELSLHLTDFESFVMARTAESNLRAAKRIAVQIMAMGQAFEAANV